MDIINVLVLVIALLSLIVSYAVFKSNDEPKIIIYIEPNYEKESIINLVIENIGNSAAFNVIFESDRKIPSKAFGLDGLNDPIQYFESGIFVHGIKVFNPKQKYVYDWGQFNGLKEALNNKDLFITAKYHYKYPLNFWTSRVTEQSIININELENLPMNQGGIHQPLKDIVKKLDKINSSLSEK